MLKFLCDNADKSVRVDLTSIFTFIGMAFCIIVAVVALVWLTCFVVRLLIKTFKTQVQNSYDIFVENSAAKTKSKKERNAIKRKAQEERKLEILNMKLESQERIHQMQVEKLGKNLLEKEEKAKEKYGIFGVKTDEKLAQKTSKKPAKTNDIESEVEDADTEDELLNSNLNEEMEVAEETNLESETLAEEPISDEIEEKKDANSYSKSKKK